MILICCDGVGYGYEKILAAYDSCGMKCFIPEVMLNIGGFREED
jgi:hypothetical protein